jgi:TolB-like protein/class 3 adenylate cyclase
MFAETEDAMKQPVQRRLAAILATDVAGYSRLMGADEEGTHERLKVHLSELVEPKIGEHRGRIVKSTGDGFLAEFASVVDAVRCAVELQREMADREPEMPEERRIRFRIGINLGDVIVEEHDIFGDGVNVAARLEALAQPGSICVSRVVRDQIRDRLDYTFEDMGEQQVKNIARPVRVYRMRDASTAANSPVSPSQTVLPLPDKPSIAVLPFQNMSGDPEQEYFADGMVEEIITALSRIRWLFVIARNSSFTYKSPAIDVKQVGRELGVRYVLEGSVRRAGGQVRITAQLIEAETSAHLWADRFDGSLQDVFELQDQVAASVAGVIEPALQAAEIRRLAQSPTNDMTAYDLYLRALKCTQAWDRQRTVEGLELLERAVTRDPGFGTALSLAALCHLMLHMNGWTEEPEVSRLAGLDLARRALRAAAEDPCAIIRAAYALGYFGEDIGIALALADRALEMNPSFAVGWYYSAYLRLWAGLSDLAIEHLATAVRLSPHDMAARALFATGLAFFIAGRFEEARAKLLSSLEEFPGWAPNYRFLAACCVQMGRMDEAREFVRRLREITSVVLPDASHWRNPEQRELYLSGLRLAAGETT